MPIYEFQCTNCSNKFEIFLRHSADKEIFCPQCHASKVKRLPSIFGFKSGSNFDTSSEAKGKSCSSCFSRNCRSCR